MTLPAYYMDRIVPDHRDCWLWLGPVDAAGYGHVNVGSTTTTAHRAVYMELVGPVPHGTDLDHLCRNRSCVNPDHLEPVSHSVNAGRSHHTKRERCANGHREYVQRGDRRVCLACRREATARYYERKAVVA